MSMTLDRLKKWIDYVELYADPEFHTTFRIDTNYLLDMLNSAWYQISDLTERVEAQDDLIKTLMEKNYDNDSSHT
jgi:hypothetical protein